MFQQVLAGGRLAHRLKHNSNRKKTKYFLSKGLRKCCYISMYFCHSNHVQIWGGVGGMSQCQMSFLGSIKYLFTDKI